MRRREVAIVPRRKLTLRSDEIDVSMDAADADRRDALLELYDRALPEVYGYLLHRCGDVTVAEDLTSEVFLAAARSVSKEAPVDLTVAWLKAARRCAFCCRSRMWTL
jgi:DNA-directed RNA polymerase specialized sigma24 family protein